MMNLSLIDHIGLNVRSLEASFAFYQKVFDFAIFHKWQTTWMIQKGELKIGLFERPAAVPVCDLDDRIAISHFAFRTDKAGFDDAQKKLDNLGVPFTPPVYTGVAYAIFLLDPDGHQVEITTFQPPDQAEGADTVRAAMGQREGCCGSRGTRRAAGGTR